MTQRDKQQLKPGAGDAASAEQVLNYVIQELETLHQNVRDQLAEDITRLQTEKTSLIEDIDKLREQYRQLHSQQVETLSQRYIYQQQLWLKQLAQVLANNLQELLVQRFNELSANAGQGANVAIPSGEFPIPILANQYTERASEMLASLDASVNRTFDMMERDLSSYESSLSQRLRNMEGMERKGEALLENLVNRIRVELEEEIEQTLNLRDGDDSNTTNSVHPRQLPPAERVIRQPSLPPASSPAAPAPAKPPASQVQIGVILALVSAVVLSLFNVSLKIILKAKAPRVIFGLFEVEGVVSPGFGNSLLILLIRLLVVMALMPILATFLYPSVWKDLKRFIDQGDADLWKKVLGSAFFLFLSQVFIYIAIGNIPTGVAITIFFIYPIATVLCCWVLFGDRPSSLRFLAMAVICSGLLLAAVPSFGQKAIGDVTLGVSSAVGAGLMFAGYVLLTQMAAGKLHPIPFSLVNFAAIFVFSAISLIILPFGIGLGLPERWAVVVDPTVWTGLIWGGFLLGVLTLFSYLLNNFAIRFAGAALASVIGTLGPALTALFALIIINETIPWIQVSGLFLVTLGVLGMTLEKILMPKKPS
jgi:drug/metabolite transporter (DMT)-like permease